MSATACPRCVTNVTAPGECRKCGFSVPPQWFSACQVAIAMTGARTSGKSILIAVMMDQFESHLKRQHKSVLEPLGATEEIFHRKYREPLYLQRKLLEATRPLTNEALVPLMWSFDIAGKDYCLALTDPAGEDVQALREDDDRFAYLGQSDLIVSLIDPLKVRGIAAVVEDQARAPVDSADDVTVLRKVLAARQAHRPTTDHPQYLALTLSKFDVLQQTKNHDGTRWQAIMNRPGSMLQRDRSFFEPFENPAEQDLLQAELTGLLEMMDADLVTSAARKAGIPFRLFANSALGVSPQSEVLHHGGISPFRVLDLIKAAVGIKTAAG